ncbi:hypothetical protein BG006_000168 [Podila minutissima]|uniref:Uncharacterized protein n=1 Tax=Podila minutissima TaxID=64525 RepID=A0A9P5SFL6_9FUNG|nr:hypothetical protein BG006_000168 [Podila minutissima]
MGADMARKRQIRKDDAIRKKLDQELGRKKPSTRAHRSTKPVQGTVGSLRPSPALTLPDTAMVVDAARIMAAKSDQHLVGIMTDKDLAFRVIAEGLDIRSTLIAQVMTKNPFCVTTETNATEALNKMVNGGFRHLPCLNAEGDVVGLLDITKCLYEALEKLEKAHQSSKKLADALEGMQSEWAQPANQGLQNYVELMREKMASPDLNTILDENRGAAEVQTKTSVREASRLMKQYHTTASLIMEDGRIAGIFTTKDIVVRVMAAGLEPDTTSVIRVMTPHPNTVSATMTILDALKTMHSNHYLHLPVVDERGRMVGLVDVLQVSFAMLSQMNTMQGESNNIPTSYGASDGPVWNKFWETSFSRDDTGSDVSASDVRSTFMPSNQSEMHYGPNTVGTNPIRGTSTVGSYRPSTDMQRVTPPPAQQQQPMSPPASPPSEFTFKFKEPKGEQVHRFTSSRYSFSELYTKVQGKMGNATEATLSYCDEENDQVLILQDSDVADAVEMAARNQWPLIRLVVTLKGQVEVEVAPEVPSKPMVVPEEVKTESPKSDVSPVPKDETGALANIVNSGIAKGVDPMVLTGAIGLGLGVGIALLFAMMKK